MKDLTKGSPARVILQFAIPVLIGNLFNLLYNLADIRIVGSFLGTEALAAIGSVSTLNDLLVLFLIGLSNGFAVKSALFYGMGKTDRVKKTFTHSLMYGLVITLVLVAFCVLALNPILSILNVMGEHREAAAAYITIILYGLFFTIVYNTMAAVLRSVGDAVTPLLFLVFSTILNVGLDLLCVGALQLGVQGAAWATVIAQMVSVVLCFTYIRFRYPFLHFTLRDMKPDLAFDRSLLAAGFSMGLMSCLVQFGTLTLQGAINTLGTNVIVAHAATRKLTTFYMMPFSTLATTMSTYVSQNHGAGKTDRIKQGLKTTLLMSYAWCVVVLVISYTICPWLIHLITDTTIQEVMNTGALYQRVDTIFYALVPTISILRNSLQGLGVHIVPVISSALELSGKVLIAIFLTPVFGYWAIIWSEPIVWFIMLIPLVISMRRKMLSICKKDSRG
ncbi:MAG: MATE family efflux transporter [Lachnospiraceae bacterium]|nr:MATE family efflux transporter [Lachnospiraceae bacterium]